MGRYFSLHNITRNQCVSEGDSCWKSYPQCSIYGVMHEFGWESKDKISSSSYCDYFEFVYDEKTNTMEMVDKLESVVRSPPDETKETKNSIEITRMSFSEKNIEKFPKVNDHVPKWNNNRCEHCGYILDPKLIEELTQKRTE